MSYPTENQRAWTEFEEKICDPKGMWGLLVWCEHEDKKHRHLPLALPSPCFLQTSKQRIKGKRIIGSICYLGRRIDVYIFGRRLGNIFPINKLFPYYVFPTLLAPTSAGRMYTVGIIRLSILLLKNSTLVSDILARELRQLMDLLINRKLIWNNFKQSH